MVQLQFEAVAPPLTSPGLGTLAARLLTYAAVMELLPEPGVATLDYETLVEGLQHLTRATGVGSSTLVSLREERRSDAGVLRERLHDLYEELEDSPAPQVEWRPMDALLGRPLLSALVCTSPSSVERYEKGERSTPDDVADRLHVVALTVSDLAGGYNEFGVRRWFDRPRSALDGRSPREVLEAPWNSDSDGAVRIRTLARSLTASPAT